MATRTRLFSSHEIQTLLLFDKALVTVEPTKTWQGFRHEVTLSSSPTSVAGEITIQQFMLLTSKAGVKTVTLLFPGMGPFLALVSVNNVVTRDYEVNISYVHRPDDPVEF